MLPPGKTVCCRSLGVQGDLLFHAPRLGLTTAEMALGAQPVLSQGAAVEISTAAEAVSDMAKIARFGLERSRVLLPS
jgi:hypothetical protein